MNKTVRNILATSVALFAAICSANAQSVYENKVEINKSVHDFGDISVDDGAVECSFTVKNISNKAMLILNVVSSCGCTSVSWTREPIAPGKTGTISATFDNKDGAYPFDKTITVYFSDVSKPAVLHLRGVAHQAPKPLKERYTLMFGNFGVKDLEMSAGNLTRGERKALEFTIANNGITPMKVAFQDVSPEITLNVYPNPVPPKSTATLECTVKAGTNYGKNWYYATPVIDGRVFKAAGKLPNKEDDGSNIYKEPNKRLGLGKSELGIYAVVKPQNLREADRSLEPDITFTKSTQSFGKLASRSSATVVYEFKNSGKKELELFKLDAECSNVKVTSITSKVAGGKNGSIKIEVNTTGMPSGENTIVLNLYTNSPLRPVVTLQLVGEIL